MKTLKGDIKIGCFDNIDFSDDIIIMTDKNGLIELIHIIEQLSTSQNIIDFGTNQYVHDKFNLPLKAYNDSANFGMILSKNNDCFEWRLTRQKWKELFHLLNEFYERIDVAGSKKHICFDSLHENFEIEGVSDDSFGVVISYNELTTQYWEDNFLTIDGHHLP